MPRAEFVHWWFASGFVMLALLAAAELVVGPDVWAMRTWRRYLWPGLMFLMGVLLWPVMALYTNSTIHMIAHGSWAQVLMLAGAAELGLAAGKLHSQWWRLTSVLAMVVSGAALILHEQQHWLFSRAAFLHHAMGWWLICGAVFPLLRAWRPQSVVAASGWVVVFAVVAVMLFSDRDTAAVFGHLSQYAGVPHR